jgi:hypothetical protein
MSLIAFGWMLMLVSADTRPAPVRNGRDVTTSGSDASRETSSWLSAVGRLKRKLTANSASSPGSHGRRRSDMSLSALLR